MLVLLLKVAGLLLPLLTRWLVQDDAGRLRRRGRPQSHKTIDRALADASLEDLSVALSVRLDELRHRRGRAPKRS